MAFDECFSWRALLLNCMSMLDISTINTTSTTIIMILIILILIIDCLHSFLSLSQSSSSYPYPYQWWSSQQYQPFAAFLGHVLVFSSFSQVANPINQMAMTGCDDILETHIIAWINFYCFRESDCSIVAMPVRMTEMTVMMMIVRMVSVPESPPHLAREGKRNAVSASAFYHGRYFHPPSSPQTS